MNHTLQNAAPSVGAMNVAGTKFATFEIAELVEHEQRMVAGTFEVTVPDAHLLLTMGRVDARIQIEQIVLMFNNYVTAHSKKVAHGPLNSNLDHDGTFM